MIASDLSVFLGKIEIGNGSIKIAGMFAPWRRIVGDAIIEKDCVFLLAEKIVKNVSAKSLLAAICLIEVVFQVVFWGKVMLFEFEGGLK